MKTDQGRNIKRVPIIGINRHRMGIDGNGITTLVAVHDCPLRCKYCLNRQCWDGKGVKYNLSVAELYDMTKIDDLYFNATKGGICFGGGEPAMYPEFIRDFRNVAPDYWRFTIETSLNVPIENIKTILPVIDKWIIDVKDIDNEIYHKYTSNNNQQVIQNLELLSKSTPDCTVRVPLIPHYNNQKDVSRSISILKNMGFNNINQFTYIIKGL